MQHAFQVTENVQNYAAKAMQLNEHLLSVIYDVFTGAELASSATAIRSAAAQLLQLPPGHSISRWQPAADRACINMLQLDLQPSSYTRRVKLRSQPT